MYNLNGEFARITEVRTKTFSEEDGSAVVRVMARVGKYKLLLIWDSSVTVKDILKHFKVGQDVLIDKGKPCDENGNILPQYQWRVVKTLSDVSGANK